MILINLFCLLVHHLIFIHFVTNNLSVHDYCFLLLARLIILFDQYFKILISLLVKKYRDNPEPDLNDDGDNSFTSKSSKSRLVINTDEVQAGYESTTRNDLFNGN